MGPFRTWLRTPAGERTAILAGFLALAILWTWPLALRPGTTMAAPFGDPLLNAWILGWDADRLRHALAACGPRRRSIRTRTRWPIRSTCSGSRCRWRRSTG